MLIGELAESLDVSTKTLRHYEQIGVLPASSRGKNGYRVYTAEAVKQARTVVALRQLNLPIETIRELLYTGAPDTLRQRMLGALDQKRQEMALEVAILRAGRRCRTSGQRIWRSGCRWTRFGCHRGCRQSSHEPAQWLHLL